MSAPNVTGWESQILRALGAPTSANNINTLDTWVQAEGGYAANNPFNTTVQSGYSGDTWYNTFYDKNGGGPYHVLNFGSWQAGLTATVNTLNQGNFSSIKSALVQDVPTSQIGSIITSSGWGTSSWPTQSTSYQPEQSSTSSSSGSGQTPVVGGIGDFFS